MIDLLAVELSCIKKKIVLITHSFCISLLAVLHVLTGVCVSPRLPSLQSLLIHLVPVHLSDHTRDQSVSPPLTQTEWGRTSPSFHLSGRLRPVVNVSQCAHFILRHPLCTVRSLFCLNLNDSCLVAVDCDHSRDGKTIVFHTSFFCFQSLVLWVDVLKMLCWS